MTSHYANIISIACLFLCLSLASARSSLIQQVTDGNTGNMMNGFSQVTPLNTYSRDGYLRNTEYSETVVTISSPFPPNKVFQVNDKISYSRNRMWFTWTFQKFSELVELVYTSASFSREGRNWNLRVYPSGLPPSKIEGLWLFLVLNKDEIVFPGHNIYVVTKLRVLNQRQSNTVERTLTSWFSTAGSGIGFPNMVSYADLRNSSKGFVVNDVLRVECEIESVL